jgi:hypothetical protein
MRSYKARFMRRGSRECFTVEPIGNFSKSLFAAAKAY